MAKKEFQAESKKLMDMMINSIYTNKEIDFRILITRDKDNRILTIEDNGIGMTKEELEQNLGTIAHSGSLDFKKDNKDENIATRTMPICRPIGIRWGCRPDWTPPLPCPTCAGWAIMTCAF